MTVGVRVDFCKQHNYLLTCQNLHIRDNSVVYIILKICLSLDTSFSKLLYFESLLQEASDSSVGGAGFGSFRRSDLTYPYISKYKTKNK